MDEIKVTKEHQEHINKRVELALVESIYQQASLGFIASIICGTIVLAYLYFSNPEKVLTLMTWYIALMSVLLARAILVKAYQKQPKDKINVKFWRNLFTLGTLLAGLTWGYSGTPYLLPANEPLKQALILVILAGVCAGAVPLNAYIRTAAILFILATLSPLIIHFMLLQNYDYLLFDIAVIVFTLYLISLTVRTHKIIQHSFYLQFENDDLLVELSNAKQQLEISNKRLQQAATHDPLTHIANRHLFEVILQDAINRAEYDKQNLALFYLDLDKFKEVNDTYGHHAGDQLLLVVIARIKNILRDNDTIARVGGDEITIILENATHFETVTEIAERICQAVAKPIKIDNTEVQVYASIGISMYPTDGKDMKKLIEIADKAMYFVKENGGNSFHYGLENR